MEQTEYTIPANKRKATIFVAIMILLSIGMLVLITISFHRDSVPEDLTEVSCSFQSYEIRRHTRSISYDLLLISQDYDMPFKLPFFDGYKKQYSPEDFCGGSTYSLLVSPSQSSYVIYSCFDAQGNVLMTKKEAYRNSQTAAHIALTVFLIVSIVYWVFLLLICYRPDLFGDRVKKVFFGKRKSI